MVSVNDRIGNYHLIEEIASGGFGSVFRAEHTIIKRVVAVKVLHIHLNSQKEQDRFFEEAQFLAILIHPHILPIIDAGVHAGILYLVTEYAYNGSLKDRLGRRKGQALPIGEALTILFQIGQALQYAHEHSVVHRDLKPGNILFDTKGDAVLADFGIAKMLDTAGFQQASGIGTIGYMAPEQYKSQISRENDQYALGCIAYELFTGQRPFDAPNQFALMYKHLNEQPLPPRQLNPQLPEYMEQAILRALAKERSDRHPNISAFITALWKTKELELCLSCGALYADDEGYCTQCGYLTIQTSSPNNTNQKTKEQWFAEGKAHYTLKRYKQALIAFERAIQLGYDDSIVYYWKGDVLLRLERDEEALISFDYAILLDPSNAELYDLKAAALRHLNYLEKALDACDQAILLAPNEPVFYRNKAVTLVRLERFGEVLEIDEKIRQLGFKPKDSLPT